MKVLIADDHDLLRETLATFLDAQPEMEVTGARDLQEAMAMAASRGPFDVIFLDYDMPGMEGLAGLRRMIAAAPATPVAILTGSAPVGVGREAIASGAKGFLPKTLSAKSLLNALRFIAAGETYAPVASLTEAEAGGEPNNSPGLSAREVQVLSCLCAGLSNKAIASRLDLSEPTVKFHVRTLCRKLGALNRTQVVIRARELQLGA
jgi:DNA-binding NarL/FixJ family response regulator